MGTLNLNHNPNWSRNPHGAPPCGAYEPSHTPTPPLSHSLRAPSHWHIWEVADLISQLYHLVAQPPGRGARHEAAAHDAHEHASRMLVDAPMGL